MRYPLTKFVAAARAACAVQRTAALRVAMIASALVVLAAPASATLVFPLGTFTPDLCDPVPCVRTFTGGLTANNPPDSFFNFADDYLFTISGGALSITASVTRPTGNPFLSLVQGFPRLDGRTCRGECGRNRGYINTWHYSGPWELFSANIRQHYSSLPL
jgi:hypothetical protein